MFTIRRRGASRICQQFSSVLIICENETQITAQICAYKKVEKPGALPRRPLRQLRTSFGMCV